MTERGGDTASKLRAELARLTAGHPFQILGIPTVATADVVRSAFLAAAKRYHPTRFALLGQDARDVSNELFLLVRRAYSELIDDERRRAWREKVGGTGPAAALDPPRAESPRAEPPRVGPAPSPEPPNAAAKADAGAGAPEPPRRPLPRPPRGLPAPQPKRDVQDLLEQVRTRPQRTEDALQHLRKGRFRQAREALHQIAAEDTQNKRVRTYLHFAWGMEHRESGNLDEAARELERALKLDPSFAEAEKALRELGKARKGIFSKIFGRE
jgi:curved DNA-binding protein CbpA